MAFPGAVAEAAPTTRRERRKAEVRNRILEAASELFEVNGFHATTVAEIAERADVATKTFFNHFATKQAVVQELAHYSIAKLLDDIGTIRAQAPTARERLIIFFDQIAEAAVEAGPMHRELLTEIIHSASSAPDQSVQAKVVRDAFGSIVEDGIAAGEITTEHTADTITELIMGAFYALMFNWANLEEYPFQDQARAMARLLGDSIASPQARASHDKE